MKVKTESLNINKFGYQRNLLIPSIGLNPESKLKLNLQTSGLRLKVNEDEVMEIVDRIHEDTGLPIVIFIHVKSSPIICSKSPLLAERLINICN